MLMIARKFLKARIGGELMPQPFIVVGFSTDRLESDPDLIDYAKVPHSVY